MRFNRLRLSGFKSFVDPTELVIAEGLTGVVGPNGCGKSNLLEALRWVMGENRPTAMRGGGMEDVIFAGTARRPARNFAEVSLTLDNSERLAPSGFNDDDVLEITRRITRDVGSAYKANSRDVRARDVQMLFADASTGAHSPALVRQGQIAELINAKPAARRRILEEAAGISGLYQRRHEAELKLKNTEANLSRVDDVIEQLAQQLAQLARQAKQAARYRQLSEELRQAEGSLLYIRWRDADAGRAAAQAALREATAETARAEAAARKAASEREAADAALPPLREEESIAAAVLQRLEVERATLAQEEERARGAVETLEGRIAQLSRDREREAQLTGDAGETIRALEIEADELAAAGEGHEERLAAAEAAAEEAARALADKEEELDAANDAVARLAARHHAAERLVEDCRKTLARNEAEAARARDEAEGHRARLETAEDDLATAREAAAQAETTAAEAERTLAMADEARGTAQAREAEARAERSAAEGELSALEAEHAALARVVSRDTAEGGAVIDRLQVEQGFEKALGAALADDLRAPEVDPQGASGWLPLPPYDQEQPLPEGVTPLDRHVSVPEVLVRRMGQIGLVDAQEGARLQPLLKPGQRLVSLAGDLWRWDGFTAWSGDAPTAAALRLEQLNRLEALKQEMARATARLDGARDAHQSLAARLRELTEADAQAREARRKADARSAEAARALSKAEAERNLAAGRLESLRLAAARHEEEAEAARARLQEAEAALAALDDPAKGRAELETLRKAVEAARAEMMTRRGAHDTLRREGEARAARAKTVARELDGWQRRLATANERAAELSERLQAAEAELETAREVPAQVAARREDLARSLRDAEARRTAAADALAAGEAESRAAGTAEREAERAAADARAAEAAASARAEAATEAAEEAEARISEAYETGTAGLLERLGVEPEALPDAETLEAQVARIKRQRDALGAVNLRAEEDARAVQEEHDTLAQEKADLEEAVKKLRAGIAALNREGRERLLTAFEQVNANFSMLFTHLFNGGEAKLVMVESDDPLEAGLEIMCQPPGKKLSTLSLLSGGEQTLTALALIFAVFLANPAPICVLDEVDAPLDDANVTRFCDLLDEMRRRADTRFLIITHHAVTMSRMDRLFGVTMVEQGVSQLVSVDLKRAEKLVA
ncbi:chromosome segregation protein SMC [Rhodosalinus halophilus]|uniref:Chromosome partition protein Smc n=1 Tax=Rhodosalinus halophilus TaxID=2259333 RepID=A0A365UAY9_9RHOB|nr:chromosome segregation protein SMC [Rhodosalinus halophilus]RBI86206.1 chromosome segregation protein SMC [Rhodosalinus halophilus]